MNQIAQGVRPYRTALMICGSLGLAACASQSVVETYTWNATAKDIPLDSVTYYLPKQLVAIDVERSKATPAVVKPAAASAVQPPKTNPPAPAPPKPPASPKPPVTPAKPTPPPAAPPKTPAEPPGGAPPVTPPPPTNTPAVTPAGGGLHDTITVRQLPPIPDLSKRYYAYLRHSSVRDDDYGIQTTDAGLLSSTNATSTDQTGKVLTTLVSLVTEIEKFGIAIGIDSGGAAPIPCGTADGVLLVTPTPPKLTDLPQEFKTTVIFDPTNPQDISRAENQLCTLGAQYRFALIRSDGLITSTDSVSLDAQPDLPAGAQLPSTSPKPGTPTASTTTTPSTTDPCATQCDGLLYRRAQPWQLAIYKRDAAQRDHFQFVNASPLTLANAAPIERVTLPLDAAVTTKQGVKFSNGMLIERTATRPSSLVGILNIPVDVVKAVVSIPSALFQFKVSSTKDQSDLIKAQTDQIKAQTDQINAAIALKKAQDLTEPRAPIPTP
jgi:hypothetical protein